MTSGSGVRMTERRAAYAAKNGKRQQSKKVTYFGIVFDSHAEGQRYLELRAMQERGEIRGLGVHPKFELQPAFVTGSGEKVRAITYTPDFDYTQGDDYQYVVEDVKAWMTDKRTGKRRPIVQEDSKLKIKMLKYQRPDIEFRITGDK